MNKGFFKVVRAQRHSDGTNGEVSRVRIPPGNLKEALIVEGSE